MFAIPISIIQSKKMMIIIKKRKSNINDNITFKKQKMNKLNDSTNCEHQFLFDISALQNDPNKVLLVECTESQHIINVIDLENYENDYEIRTNNEINQIDIFDLNEINNFTSNATFVDFKDQKYSIETICKSFSLSEKFYDKMWDLFKNSKDKNKIVLLSKAIQHNKKLLEKLKDEYLNDIEYKYFDKLNIDYISQQDENIKSFLFSVFVARYENDLKKKIYNICISCRTKSLHVGGGSYDDFLPECFYRDIKSIIDEYIKINKQMGNYNYQNNSKLLNEMNKLSTNNKPRNIHTGWGNYDTGVKCYFGHKIFDLVKPHDFDVENLF